MNLKVDDPIASTAISAIHSGRSDELRHLLSNHPGLANTRIVDQKGVQRTLLHVASDWPGHFPNAATAVSILIHAGADPDAVVNLGDGQTGETPLHWAASSDDVDVIDALLDGGANLEASGAVFTGGTPMSDAVVFAQWKAARRLLERGAKTTLWQSAALGLGDRVRADFAEKPPATREVTNAFWHACRGGQREVAEYLLERGADMNWIGHDRKTPLQAAEESGAADVVDWLLRRAVQLARI